MNRKFILSISLFFAVGVLAFGFWTNHMNEVTRVVAKKSAARIGTDDVDESKGAVAEKSGDRLAILEADVRSLKTELMAIKLALQRAANNNFQTSSTADSESLGFDEEPSAEDLAMLRDYENELKKRGEERFSEQIANLEGQFAAQFVDPKWSDHTANAINDALSTLPDDARDGAVFRDVECRATMCRMIVEYDDPTAQAALETQLPMVVGQILPRLTATHEDDDGIVKGIYFLEMEENDPA